MRLPNQWVSTFSKELSTAKSCAAALYNTTFSIRLFATLGEKVEYVLSENSVLCRVPANVEKKQAFFIDGIRHAIEIIDLAYFRLRDNLTKLARTPPTPAELRALSPHIFLDAWAMVDASDRFRVLYQQFPGMTRKQAEGTTPLSEILEPIRKVRNIGDHHK